MDDPPAEIDIELEAHPSDDRSDWKTSRLRDAEVAVESGDYKLYHANIAASQYDLTGKRVLVVGCNRGEDCQIFVDMGAASVTGLDVMDEIGANYSHPLVEYVKASVEQIPFDSNSFDFVFAYATLEHVPDIASAFKEMSRVCSSGGLIYSAAAPLWNSRQGPHWGGIFDEEPWLHLRTDLAGIQQYNRQRDSEAPRATVEQIAYWLDDRFFNKRWAREYLAAGWSVPNVEIISNEVLREPESILPDSIYRELTAKGYSKLELLAFVHIFTARRL